MVREVRAATALFGGVATLCLERGCHSLLNGYLSFPVAMDDEGEVHVGLAGYGSVAWIQGVTRRADQPAVGLPWLAFTYRAL